MKILLIVVTSIVSILVITQILVSQSTNKTEQYKYIILKKFENFEVRKYEPAVFSTVKLNSDTYRENSGKGFRVLAGYIFGDNASNMKIAMTSPVSMELGDTTKMSFMVPKELSIDMLPKPNNSEIIFESKNEKIVAAITFDGWADDEKIEYYKSKLIEELSKQKLAHNNRFSFLGYNPPYEVVNRRNEIVVELLNFED